MGALKKHTLHITLPQKQTFLFQNPASGIQKDYRDIYQKNRIQLGWPKKENKIFKHLSRPNTVSIVGAALGDEGKGRLIDNKVETFLQKSKIKTVFVVRFQGGNNAGHTVEKNNLKLALHLVPSIVMHEKAQGIMDRGMVIHPEDLVTEIEYIEKRVGSLEKRLFLSLDAILSTDLERAEETLNTIKTEKGKGGTGRGISPSYAHHYDRLGLKMFDLVDENWKEILSKQYDRYQKEFRAFGFDLKDMEVVDFKTVKNEGKAALRKLGSKPDFLKRLEEARSWLLKRNIFANTYLIHHKNYSDQKAAVIFEGAQAAGLDAWLGTRPDVTSSNTTTYGIREGTGFWKAEDISQRIGVFKIPYTSSVGARRMPTHIDLPRDVILNPALGGVKDPMKKGKDSSAMPQNDISNTDQKWASWVRETAHEYGTTTGRPRDINFLDLPFLSYNCKMAGIEVLIGTHLDTARANQTMKVCTHYTNTKGEPVLYQPGLRYLKGIVPQYIELPGWDGDLCQKAKKLSDLPKEALQFLSFIQARLGYPIVAVTTGPQRTHFLQFSS